MAEEVIEPSLDSPVHAQDRCRQLWVNGWGKVCRGADGGGEGTV